MNARVLAGLTLVFLVSASVDARAADEDTASTVAAAMAEAAAGGGAAAALERYRALEKSGDSLDTSPGPIIHYAADLFRTKERPAAVAMMEACAEIFPQETSVHLVLGQFYWYTDERTRCVASFRKVLELDPGNKTASRYLDLLFFVPDDFEVPQLLTTSHLRIRPLTVADTELDYQAVMGSRDHIRGVFGTDDDWPADDLTLEDDRRALTNHETEHRRRSAFTYTVMTPDEKECLGCVYILPCHARKYDAQVFMWVTEGASERGLDRELFEAVRRWIAEDWPFKNVAYPGRTIDWSAWEKIDE